MTAGYISALFARRIFDIIEFSEQRTADSFSLRMKQMSNKGFPQSPEASETWSRYRDNQQNGHSLKVWMSGASFRWTGADNGRNGWGEFTLRMGKNYFDELSPPDPSAALLFMALTQLAELKLCAQTSRSRKSRCVSRFCFRLPPSQNFSRRFQFENSSTNFVLRQKFCSSSAVDDGRKFYAL